ncbi:aldehyde dehydrogenase family protein, partial [Streptomyces chrestomyceticus]|uniref:aldehyde dehydrogenase family protein n=1 Tax=Streptomyces chrestomyceticus TaxID=68185 RepID=UPI0019CFDB0E
VLQGYGDEAGAPLVSDAGVRRISFTGSVPTARRIARAAAANLVPTSFELGGKSPLLVFADADLDLAATRLLVEDSVRDAFLERFLNRASALVQGDPR